MNIPAFLEKKIPNLILLFFTLLAWVPCVSGQVSEVSHQFGANDAIVITYQLDSDIPGQQFEVTVTCSQDNFRDPLTFVSGDVGPSVTADDSLKTIVWDAAKELSVPAFGIQFRVTAVPNAPPPVNLTVQVARGKRVLKKKKSYQITWENMPPAYASEVILVQGATRIAILEAADPGVNSFTWEVPADLPKGEGYQIQVIDPIRSFSPAISQEFRIKKKSVVPGIITGSLLAIGAGVGYYLYQYVPDLPPAPLPGN